jgi:murein DD-endopeptidase MepM/ murein hydrolase activator NlpD
MKQIAALFICNLLLVVFVTHDLPAQKRVYPTDYFRPPVDFRILLSGTFGEIRANHFHSGIDIKTGGAEGAKVYAVADGYVSRIKVSPYGFGKALYITHPNGFVSVYGHLKGYNSAIGEYVKTAQYRAENFEIELFPSPDELPVRRGEVVAISGNSGSSGGPHVHFEMRDEATQKIINPLLFGYEVKDFYKPRITSVKIYPEDANSAVNGSSRAVRYLTEGWGEGHRLAGNPAIRLSGNISFAIQAFDQQNDTDNKNGPYGIALYIDSLLVYEFRMETFAFDQTRYVNSLLDYEELVRNNVRLQRTCIDPGNKLDIYDEVKNRGIFNFSDSLTHTIRYEVTDVPGNVAVLEFRVQSVVSGQQSAVSGQQSLQSQPSTFNYNASNHFENTSVILDAPKGVFYKSFEFRYDSARRVTGTYSSIHKIHNRYTPVHDYITLAIRPQGLPERLRLKALLVRMNDEGAGFSSAGGAFEEPDGFVRAKIREFGNYAVAVDTIPPKIRPVNAESFKNLAGATAVKFTISDELSGIASYRGTLNGKWILMDYDAKNDLLIYMIDERLLAGQNAFELKVTDAKGNSATYKSGLTR